MDTWQTSNGVTWTNSLFAHVDDITSRLSHEWQQRYEGHIQLMPTERVGFVYFTDPLISASIFGFMSIIVNLSGAGHSLDERDGDAMISNVPRLPSCLGTICECW